MRTATSDSHLASEDKKAKGDASKYESSSSHEGLDILKLLLQVSLQVADDSNKHVGIQELLKTRQAAFGNNFCENKSNETCPSKLSFAQRLRKNITKKNNNEEPSLPPEKKPVLDEPQPPVVPALGEDLHQPEAATPLPEDLSMLQRFALNALNLTAPASSVLLKNHHKNWIQLSGHPGCFAPAGPGTLWKKRTGEPTETRAYHTLMKDPAKCIVPTFFRELRYNDEYFIEMQDLLFEFHNPCVMDIKMGSRTFLESEVSNRKARNDLYQKMVKVDINEPTPKENEAQAVTKLRYMEFRDNMSSSRSLGFRIEALKMSNCPEVQELRTVRTREEVLSTLTEFIQKRESTKKRILRRLRQIKTIFESSPFFNSHEVIGSSLFIVYDNDKAGIWMIDFAKTMPLPEGVHVTHKDSWKFGNHEEGFLTGLENLIKVIEEVSVIKSRRLPFFNK